ncbi:hypothetical protein [Bowmanella dokdonensis]|uniref:Solute-binding protein family 3/N-terminal domain-containing protein n=1 Tax=Bowmanella dokdonensis TaxID=751969 RepID=A0A939DPW6_9ALTE|nr:hypothetical protein [Bowmanella dokdonensis]MBN7826610.1 hypothetical protein [Bowmanella dokdonensis]
MLCVRGGAASQPQQVTWGAASFPPFWQMGQGEHPGGAFGDVQQLVLDKLMQYRHEFYYSNFNRLLLTMQKGERLCLFGLRKTEQREVFLRFSEPFLPLPEYGVIYRHEERARLQPYLLASGRVSLDGIISDRRLLIGHVGGRSLGREMDSLLLDERSKPRATVFIITNIQTIQPLMGMLNLKRLDLVLGNALEARYYGSLLTGAEAFDFMPVQEGQRQLAAHFACSKGAWSESLIAQINELITDPQLKAQAAERFATYLPASDRQRYLAGVAESLDQALGSNVNEL